VLFVSFLCPEGGHIVIGPSVRLSVFPSHFAFRFRKMLITSMSLQIATWYLTCMCISWSCTFWVVKGQGHPSRSKVKYMGQNRSKGDIVYCVLQTHTLLCYVMAFQSSYFFMKYAGFVFSFHPWYHYVFFACYILRPNVRVKQFNHLQRHLWRGLQS